MTQKPVLRYNNLSGHVAMSARTNNFYQEIARKELRIMLKHECGMGQKVSANNPILATRTAREKPKHLDFDTPAPVHEDRYARWQFPETDVGLISQLPSQKEKFARIRNKELEYQQRLDFHNSKLNETVDTDNNDVKQLSLSNNQIASETASSSSSISKNNVTSDRGNNNDDRQLMNQTATSSSTSSSDISSRSTNHSNNTTDTKNKPIKNTNNLSSSSPVVVVKDCYSQNVTDFKKTLNSNPDMMNMYRAKRAAAFIEKQSKKNQTPYVNEDNYNNNNKTASEDKSLSSSRLSKNPDLNSLLYELKATEDKIQNLQIKVGLQSKTKGYERPTSHNISGIRRTSIN